MAPYTEIEKIYTFTTRDSAWAFMRACDDAGKKAGYPSLQAPYTVRVLQSVRTSIPSTPSTMPETLTAKLRMGR